MCCLTVHASGPKTLEEYGNVMSGMITPIIVRIILNMKLTPKDRFFSNLIFPLSSISIKKKSCHIKRNSFFKIIPFPTGR